MERNLKQASFPEYKTLDEFDLSEQPSLSRDNSTNCVNSVGSSRVTT